MTLCWWVWGVGPARALVDFSEIRPPGQPDQKCTFGARAGGVDQKYTFEGPAATAADPEDVS